MYKREVIAREKQADALETIVSRIFVLALDGKFGEANIAEGVVCVAFAISELAREVATVSEKLEK